MSSIIKSLKVISDPTRIRLLTMLSKEELSVLELQLILQMGQSRISTQLSKLKEVRLVDDRRQGKNNLYCATIPAELTAIVQQAAQEISDMTNDLKALQHILRKRQDAARAYFDDLAGKFGRHYVPGRSWKALAEALLKILNYETVADLGAGEGTLSQLLAQRAKHVIAIDNSEKMVEFGTTLAKDHHLNNLEYRLGDISNPPIDDHSVDLAIFSQALHHAERPQQALNEAFRILKPHGTLVILDLAQHQFEQARELYHDVWLGFSEVNLSSMLETSGFHHIETIIADKESEAPHFQTLLAVARKK